MTEIGARPDSETASTGSDAVPVQGALSEREFQVFLRLAKGETIPLRPEAKTIMDARLSKDDPEANCLPTGVPRIDLDCRGIDYCKSLARSPDVQIGAGLPRLRL